MTLLTFQINKECLQHNLTVQLTSKSKFKKKVRENKEDSRLEGKGERKKGGLVNCAYHWENPGYTPAVEMPFTLKY